MDHLTVSTIISALPFPAVATDSDHRILAMNGPGRDMLGLRAEDGNQGGDDTLFAVVPPAERERFEAAAAALASVDLSVNSFPSVSFEVLRETPHGERPCHVTVTPLRHDEAALTGYLLSSRDLGVVPDDRRRREQDAARMEVARQLAATMNHEVNNPLFVVSATIEDLLAEIQDPAEQRRLNAALEAVWRVSSAVKKLSEIRQLVTTAYIDGFPMIDLDASQAHPGE